MNQNGMNIICDIHDVLIKGLEGSEKQIAAELGLPEAQISSQLFSNDFTDLWCGRKPEKIFFQEMIERNGWRIKIERLLDLIYSNFQELPGTREIYRKLGRQHHTIALSVTCSEWADYMENNYRVSGLFEGRVHYSYQLGHTKREPEAFNWLIGKYSLNPANTILIDDSSRNIGVAGQLGIRGIKFRNKSQLINDLKIYNISL